jgi:hypothetical protein
MQANEDAKMDSTARGVSPNLKGYYTHSGLWKLSLPEIKIIHQQNNLKE